MTDARLMDMERLIEAAQAVVDLWVGSSMYGSLDSEEAVRIDALANALRSTPATPKEGNR
jgi:hypothetical protein